jgi:hypothetical protein
MTLPRFSWLTLLLSGVALYFLMRRSSSTSKNLGNVEVTVGEVHFTPASGGAA